MHSDMGDVEFYTLCALLVGFLVGCWTEAKSKNKLNVFTALIIIHLVMVLCLVASDAFAGSSKYNSKSRKKPPPQTIMERESVVGAGASDEASQAGSAAG